MIKKYRFTCKYLNNQKKIVTVVLPKEYDGIKEFPVIYMHDAQNLFSFCKSPYGTWDVDKMIDDMIIVGLENAEENRTAEYTPFELNENLTSFYNAREFLVTQGNFGFDYATFLVKQVKPFIDKTFKTKPNYENTFLAGSSLGGLISLTISCKYHNVFSVIGVFSIASHFINQDKLKYFEENISRSTYYLSVGGNEGFGDKKLTDEYLNQHYKIKAILEKTNSNFESYVYENAVHNEREWKKQFPDFLNLIRKRA